MSVWCRSRLCRGLRSTTPTASDHTSKNSFMFFLLVCLFEPFVSVLLYTVIQLWAYTATKCWYCDITAFLLNDERSILRTQHRTAVQWWTDACCDYNWLVLTTTVCISCQSYSFREIFVVIILAWCSTDLLPVPTHRRQQLSSRQTCAEPLCTSQILTNRELNSVLRDNSLRSGTKLLW